MFGRKKNKLDTNFVKQNFTGLVFKQHLKLFDILENQPHVMGNSNHEKAQALIQKQLSDSLKGVDVQYERYMDVARRVDNLQHKQKIRRQKWLDWFNNYVNDIEKDEIKRLVDKNSFGCERKLLQQILNLDNDFTDYVFGAEIFDLSEFEEPIEEEVEETEEDVLEENTEDDSLVEEDNETEEEKEEQKDEKGDIENIVNS